MIDKGVQNDKGLLLLLTAPIWWEYPVQKKKGEVGMKKLFINFTIVCLVLVTFVSCGKEKYWGTYNTTQETTDSYVRMMASMGGVEEGSAEWDSYYTVMAPVVSSKFDYSIKFYKDGSASLSGRLGGENMDVVTTYVVDDERHVYIDSSMFDSIIFQFAEDYSYLEMSVSGIKMKFYKVEE